MSAPDRIIAFFGGDGGFRFFFGSFCGAFCAVSTRKLDSRLKNPVWENPIRPSITGSPVDKTNKKDKNLWLNPDKNLILDVARHATTRR